MLVKLILNLMNQKMSNKEKCMEAIEGIIALFIFLTLLAWIPMGIVAIVWLFFFTVTIYTKLLIVSTVAMYIYSRLLSNYIFNN